MHPGHEVINILGSRAFDGLLDVGSISPVVLIPAGNNDEKYSLNIFEATEIRREGRKLLVL